MPIEYLTWDSNFFERKIGRINISDHSQFDVYKFVDQVEDENYDLLYVDSFQRMLPFDIITRARLELVDIQITLSKLFNKNEYQDIPFDFKTALTEKEMMECYEIAEQTARVSRFYNEPFIGPDKTRELYRKWIDNSLNKSFSDGLFLIKENEIVVGLHVIKTENETGYFTLTVVDQNFRRMRIGYRLCLQSFCYWAQCHNIKMVKSPFSFQNSESFNFHLKMGFNKIEEIKYLYHYRKLLF
jgi:dTDP-4-amino-4,6-dideoxy-D-galactose acyltransferase